MRFVIPIAAAWLLLAAPAAARAATLLVVDENGVHRSFDPHLPSRTASDLPPAPSGAARPAPSARASGRRRTTVRMALLRHLREGRIGQEDHDRWRESYETAREVRGRLSGARRAELSSVIRAVERLAASEELSVERLVPVFLILQRNTSYWRSRPFPSSGARIVFGEDPAIFQYYPGRGIQLQPLANFGKANQLHNACTGTNTRPGTPCRRGALRDLLDRLLELGSRRGGFLTWEYFFTFGGGTPPWTSGLSQGTAVQALARGSELLGEPAYLQAAADALGAFERRWPVGIRRPMDGGNHYLIYSFNPRLLVLNGFLQSVIGLHDYARISGDPRGAALYAAGERAARAAVPRHDTGAWSLYADRGRESDLGYHRLVRDFLRGLCERTADPLYCDTAERFTRYLHEHPRLELLGPKGGARARRTVRYRFRLSKLSRVQVHVSRRGKVVHSQRSTVGYGLRSFAWTPRSPGTYRVRIEAADLRNHHTVRRARVRVGRARR